MSSPKKWWHFVLPRKFYYCHVLGGDPPKMKHTFHWQARREAVRLATVTGLPVYVLGTVEVVLPQQRAPAPAMQIASYIKGQLMDHANDPADITPFEEVLA